jgi:hypothetical protein
MSLLGTWSPLTGFRGPSDGLPVPVFAPDRPDMSKVAFHVPPLPEQAELAEVWSLLHPLKIEVQARWRSGQWVEIATDLPHLRAYRGGHIDFEQDRADGVWLRSDRLSPRPDMAQMLFAVPPLPGPAELTEFWRLTHPLFVEVQPSWMAGQWVDVPMGGLDQLRARRDGALAWRQERADEAWRSHPAVVAAAGREAAVVAEARADALEAAERAERAANARDYEFNMLVSSGVPVAEAAEIMKSLHGTEWW